MISKAGFYQLLIAATASYVGIGLYKIAAQSYRDNAPATDWLTVNSVVVPDHRRGFDPAIIYDRVVNKPVTATWVAEVERFQPSGKGYSVVCTGSDTNNYDATSVVPDDVTLSWFMGKECGLKIGQYRLCTSWSFQPPHHPQKKVKVCSPPFHVNEAMPHGQ